MNLSYNRAIEFLFSSAMNRIVDAATVFNQAQAIVGVVPHGAGKPPVGIEVVRVSSHRPF